jgi:hypothetical protein
MPPRPWKTGYQPSTMLRRIEDLADEAVKMGEDGRLPPEVGLKLARNLLRVHQGLGHFLAQNPQS